MYLNEPELKGNLIGTSPVSNPQQRNLEHSVNVNSIMLIGKTRFVTRSRVFFLRGFLLMVCPCSKHGDECEGNCSRPF
jgi:hypothetical protein